MKRIIVILAALSVLAGCSAGPKDVDCVYIVNTHFQDEEKGPVAKAENVVGYIFYADTTEWKPASYDDAEAGVVTSSVSGRTRSYDLMSEPGNISGGLELGAITSTAVMAVVCFKDTRSYAYRRVPMEPGIGRLTVGLTFRTWKTTAPYTDSKWTVVGQTPPHTVNCTYLVATFTEEAQGGPDIPVTDGVGYAFYADASQWKVTSFENAMAGIISPQSGTGDLNYDIAGTLTADGKISIAGITRRRVMIVICDPESQCYAWRQATIDYNVPVVEDSFSFPLWAEGITVHYPATGWTAVGPPKPEPEPEPEPESEP